MLDLLLPALGTAALFSVVAAAGFALHRELLGATVPDEGGLVSGLLCGLALLVLAYFPGAILGPLPTVWGLALAGPLALYGSRETRKALVAALKSDGPRVLGYLALGVVFTAFFHGRQFEIGEDRVAWHGTLSWDALFHASTTRALVEGWPAAHLGSDGELPIAYHFFSHLVFGAVTELTPADVIQAYFRVVPPVLLAVALESHHFLLRAWFQRSRGLAVAAIAPLLAMDLDLWLRLFDVKPVEQFSNRTAMTLLNSPSFVLGQAYACFVIGATARLVERPLHALPRAVPITLGVLLGMLAGWKLPSFLVTALALVSLLPLLYRRVGPAPTRNAAVAALVAAAASYLLCFHPPGGAGVIHEDRLRFGLALPFESVEGYEGAPGIALLALLYLVQTAGPRLLRLDEMVRMARRRPSLVCVLVTLAAGVLLPLFVEIWEHHEEKYLRRCGTYFALLVTAALVAEALPTREWRRRALFDCAVFAAFAVAVPYYALKQETSKNLIGGDALVALRTLGPGDHVLVQAQDRRYLGHAVSALTGANVRYEARGFLEGAGFEETRVLDTPTGIYRAQVMRLGKPPEIERLPTGPGFRIARGGDWFAVILRE